MRALLLMALILAPVALGQTPDGGSPARKASPRKPAASLGSGKDDDFEPAPLPAPNVPAVKTRPRSSAEACEADAALTRGLLFAFEPAPLEIRVIAIEDLAL